jgi:hypothetical protein
MSKRFLDTGFLDQKWIRKLSPEKKIFLIYLMLKCDNAGIIDLDLDDASFWIGKKIDNIDFLPEYYLIPLNGSGKYFMPKYIEWQYKDLSSNKNIVVQSRQLLEKYNLINPDFSLKLDNNYINVKKDLPESQVTGIGIGIGIGNSKGKEKPDFDFHFVDAKFIPVFMEWIAYKKSRNENYKTQQSLEACYRNLLRLSQSNSDKAKLILDQAMGNNWQGLAPLKTELKTGGSQVQGSDKYLKQ